MYISGYFATKQYATNSVKVKVLNFQGIRNSRIYLFRRKLKYLRNDRKILAVEYFVCCLASGSWG